MGEGVIRKSPTIKAVQETPADEFMHHYTLFFKVINYLIGVFLFILHCCKRYKAYAQLHSLFSTDVNKRVKFARSYGSATLWAHKAMVKYQKQTHGNKIQIYVYCHTIT